MIHQTSIISCPSNGGKRVVWVVGWWWWLGGELEGDLNKCKSSYDGKERVLRLSVFVCEHAFVFVYFFDGLWVVSRKQLAAK